jgi:polysaccharide export outer membrane protein
MAKYKNNILLILLTGIFILSSCVSNKKFVYLQDKGNVKLDSNGTMAVIPFTYKLQKADVLYISLTTDDEKLNRVFVPSAGGGSVMQQSQSVSGTGLYYIGFTIDTKGEIEFPYLGKVKVEGLQIEEAKTAIETQLKKFFKIFFIQVKLAEFKFTILGMINKPGQYFYQQNKVSIIEAISQAGELQNIAERLEVQLYRQYPEGVKLHIVNLTDRSIINSPFWYIQPNDILYVVPIKSRSIGDLSSLQSSFNVIAPLLSAMLLVLNTYILVTSLK